MQKSIFQINALFSFMWKYLPAYLNVLEIIQKASKQMCNLNLF